MVQGLPERKERVKNQTGRINMTMKKIICVLFALTIATGISVAQQRYKGQWILKVSGGGNLTAKGYYGEIGAEKILQNTRHSLQLSFAYNHNTHSSKIGENIKVNNYYGFFDYYYTFSSISSLRFSLSFGPFIGYQDFSNKIVDGVKLNAKPRFLFGFSTAPQLDLVIAPTLSLYLQPKLIYSIKSDIDDFSFFLGIGLTYRQKY